MKIKKVLTLIVILPVLSSCSSINTSNDMRGDRYYSPSYNEYIARIVKPIYAKYKPGLMFYKYTFKNHIVIRNKYNIKRISNGYSIYYTLSSIRLGSHLSWSLNVSKYIDKNHVYAPISPLISITYLTNLWGKKEGINISSPALVAAHVSKNKITKFITSIRESMSGAGGSLLMARLVKTPIKSGRILWAPVSTVALNSSLEKYGIKILDEPNPAGNTVLGWGSMNGKKVIVISLDKSFTATMSGVAMQFRVTGYSLVDPHNFMVLKARVLMLGNTSSKNQLKVSMQVRASLTRVDT